MNGINDDPMAAARIIAKYEASLAVPTCPACGKQRLVRNGELIQCTRCGEIADELPNVKFQRLVDALELILPMAKAYAYANKVGNNLAFIQSAEETLAACKS